MRWKDLPRPTRPGKTVAKRAEQAVREREALREEPRSDYEKFQQAGDAAVARRTEEAKARCEQRIEEYLKAVEWAAAYERFEKLGVGPENSDRIEDNIN
jgi:hypothetical protein